MIGKPVCGYKLPSMNTGYTIVMCHVGVLLSCLCVFILCSGGVAGVTNLLMSGRLYEGGEFCDSSLIPPLSLSQCGPVWTSVCDRSDVQGVNLVARLQWRWYLR